MPKPQKTKTTAQATRPVASSPIADETDASGSASAITPAAGHDQALQHADEVVSFLRSKGSLKLSAQQRADWQRILEQLIALAKSLKLIS